MLTVFLAMSLSTAGASPREVAALTPDMRAELVELDVVQGDALAVDDRVLVVDFFASWCGPCRGQLSELSALQVAHPDKVQVVAVNVFEDYNGISNPARLKAFVRKSALPFTVLLGTAKTRALFGDVARIPTVLVFDAAGNTVLAFTHDQPDQHGVSADELAALLGG